MARYPVKLAYELMEPKGGSKDHLSPLIFLHAGTLSKEEGWGDIPQIIADLTQRKAYKLDARNHGDSEWSDEFDFDLCAMDLLHFIDEKKLSKVVIIGHCLGGVMGIKATLKAPEKIEMLFVEDIFIALPEIMGERILRYLTTWKEAEKLIPPELDKSEADKFITLYAYRKYHPNTNPVNLPDFPIDFSYSLKKDCNGHYAFKANLEVILQKWKDVKALMGTTAGIFEGPSYFFIATESPFEVGKQKNNILKLFPNAVIIPFEGKDHFIHKEFRERFIETVVKHIKLN